MYVYGLSWHVPITTSHNANRHEASNHYNHPTIFNPSVKPLGRTRRTNISHYSLAGFQWLEMFGPSAEIL